MSRHVALIIATFVCLVWAIVDMAQGDRWAMIGVLGAGILLHLRVLCSIEAVQRHTWHVIAREARRHAKHHSSSTNLRETSSKLVAGPTEVIGAGDSIEIDADGRRWTYRRSTMTTDGLPVWWHTTTTPLHPAFMRDGDQ